MTTPSLAKQFFEFDTEHCVAILIKAGVLRTFEHYVKAGIRSERSIRRDLTHALLSLAAVKVSSPKANDVEGTGGNRQAIKFFSGRKGALVEIYQDEDTDVIMAKTRSPAQDTGSSQSASTVRSDHFVHEMLERTFGSPDPPRGVVAQTVIHGVISILVQADDTAGPSIEQFKEHVELFKQLGRIYAEAKRVDLDEEKGCYSHGVDVEEAIRTLESSGDESEGGVPVVAEDDTNA